MRTVSAVTSAADCSTGYGLAVQLVTPVSVRSSGRTEITPDRQILLILRNDPKRHPILSVAIITIVPRFEIRNSR